MKNTLNEKPAAERGKPEAYNIKVTCHLLPDLHPNITTSVMLSRRECSEFGIKLRLKPDCDPRRPEIVIPFEKFSRAMETLRERGDYPPMPKSDVIYWQYQFALERYRNRNQKTSRGA